QQQSVPFPFDLTTMQREAHKLFGYSPKQTLDIAQSLYEHAYISYPRTSSQKLPANIGYKTIITQLSEQPEYAKLCEKLIKRASLKPNEGKKEDPAHPAIFPTGQMPKTLNQWQKKIYDLIVKRFLATFADPAVREHMKVVLDIEEEEFASHGVRTVKANWIDFYKPYAKFKEQTLPQMKEGEVVEVKKLGMLDKETQPPNRLTQASVLKEMETNNLGTKATRAHIIHTLYDRGYIKEESIMVTKLGDIVIAALKEYCPEILSADMTKEMEKDMELIREGKKKKEDVLEAAKKGLKAHLEKFKKHEKDIGQKLFKNMMEVIKEETTIGTCLKCKKDLVIRHSRAGKRFVGCMGYPKCTETFSLPHFGKLTILSETCKKCGLSVVLVRAPRKRPWKLCVHCGFVNKIPKKGAKGKAGKKAPAKKGTKTAAKKAIPKKPAAEAEAKTAAKK
ncbi:MAG: DNA topoisomerase, partial [Candidatus Aenigmarchaeota archaeon]